MNNSLKISRFSNNYRKILATSIIACLVGIGFISYTILNPPQELTKPPSLVMIYVNESIAYEISDLIRVYAQDIESQGYKVNIINWSDSSISDLKSNLYTYWQHQNLCGAVLVGDLPYANACSNGEIFPCDLFLTDLNGTWVDINGDGVYENQTGHIYPEIFLGRINPEVLTTVNRLAVYNSYFSRNHARYMGQLSRSKRMLLYIDDTWVDNTNALQSEITAYTGGNLSCYNDIQNTNASNYLGNITLMDYEFVHVLVHSDFHSHYFMHSGPDNVLNSTILATYDTKPLFYNLYACSAARFNETDNLGTQYLFNNNTLVVVGSTKVGGMILDHFFYTPLNQGLPIGEAFRLWFCGAYFGLNNLYSPGMCLLGDPFLKI